MVNLTELAKRVRSATAARNTQDAAAADQLAAKLSRLQQKVDSHFTKAARLIDKNAGPRTENVNTRATPASTAADERAAVEEELDKIAAETELVIGGERILIWEYLGREWDERIVSIAYCVPVTSA
jgi:uncharacterized membrane-anchored protein YhcB (DUF1043 family)